MTLFDWPIKKKFENICVRIYAHLYRFKQDNVGHSIWNKVRYYWEHVERTNWELKKIQHLPPSPKENNWVYGMHVVVLTDLAIVFVTYFGLGYWQGHESWGHSVNYSPIPTNTHKQLNSLNWERGYLILTALGIQYKLVNQKSHFEFIGPLGCTVLKAYVRAQSKFHVMDALLHPIHWVSTNSVLWVDML